MSDPYILCIFLTKKLCLMAVVDKICEYYFSKHNFTSLTQVMKMMAA
jgi:hypothetical protein